MNLTEGNETDENEANSNSYIIDRIEEEKIAVCENCKHEVIEIDASLLPANAKEGDCVVLRNGCYEMDYNKSKELADDVNALFEKLKNVVKQK